MEVRNLFDTTAFNEISERIIKLSDRARMGLINQEVLAQVCQTVTLSIIKYQEDSLTNLCRANSNTEVNHKSM